ncbi:hypothetical protein TNCV_4583601 [Trichonephila clavipes]|nr:hypothetical protein TNCV_4583601 [Trichonephila clavipes]
MEGEKFPVDPRRRKATLRFIPRFKIAYLANTEKPCYPIFEHIAIAGRKKTVARCLHATLLIKKKASVPVQRTGKPVVASFRYPVRYSDEVIRLNASDYEESEESADVIDNILANSDLYVTRNGIE